MSWTQDKSPNLDPVVYSAGRALLDWYGWCLATVETAFGVPRLYPTAWAAWLATQFKHEDRNFPIGVYFAIWFSGYGGAGHVAIAYVNDSGQMNIWTSPFTHVPYFYTGYHNVDTLAKGYGVTYIGWSEDLSGTRLIEYVAPAPTRPYTVQTIDPKQVVAPKGATKWSLGDTTWSQFNGNPQGELAPNTPITVVAIAHHNLGGQYYMEDPNVPAGYNIVDMEDYTPPVQPDPVPVETTQPSSAPDPTPVTPATAAASAVSGNDPVSASTPQQPTQASPATQQTLPALPTPAQPAKPTVMTMDAPNFWQRMDNLIKEGVSMLTSFDKAIAGGLVTMVVAWLARYHITLSPLAHDTLGSVTLAVVTYIAGHVVVYLAKNKPPLV